MEVSDKSREGEVTSEQRREREVGVSDKGREGEVTSEQPREGEVGVPKTTAYKRWNCQVIRPANCCHLILSTVSSTVSGSESVCSG